MFENANNIINIHPGEILSEDFLKPMGITPYRLAKTIGVPQTRVSDIIHGKRPITPDTAIRLGRFFNMSADFWLNAQAHYDVREAYRAKSEQYDFIKPYQTAA